MQKSDNLLRIIANEFSIVQGSTESVASYRTRIVYSLLGRMALASLFDVMDDMDDGKTCVTITHCKNRIETILNSYIDIYQDDLKYLTSIDCNKIKDEIYDIYLNTGNIYHCGDNCISPVMKSNTLVKNILLTRGYELDCKQCISGLGSYIVIDDDTLNSYSATYRLIFDMFVIDKNELTIFESLIKLANWKEFNYTNQYVEYLSLNNFSRGYWSQTPDKKIHISLFRTGHEGAYLYYLYKRTEDKILVSRLPEWRVNNGEYLAIANSCLFVNNLLPPINYSYDGNLVTLNFNYMPSLQILNLFKLYSWPNQYKEFPSNFSRVCDSFIFEILKMSLEEMGYSFIEV